MSRDGFRPGARKRGYNSRWESAAAEYKLQHPWCEGCRAIGIMRPADVVDHIVPHRGNEVLFWAKHNWQPACGWHHNAIKPALERLHQLGKIASAELVLTSATAVQLTRQKHRPAIGADGFAIPGT